MDVDSFGQVIVNFLWFIFDHVPMLLKDIHNWLEEWWWFMILFSFSIWGIFSWSFGESVFWVFVLAHSFKKDPMQTYCHGSICLWLSNIPWCLTHKFHDGWEHSLSAMCLLMQRDIIITLVILCVGVNISICHIITLYGDKNTQMKSHLITSLFTKLSFD